MTENQEYYIGIDWGVSKCGLAIADSENRIATPLKEIETDKLLDELEEIAGDFEIGKIVVGATENNLEKLKRLEMEEKGWPIVFENEDFSTLMAQKNIGEFRSKGVTKNDNAESAKIILQSWLDKNSNR